MSGPLINVFTYTIKPGKQEEARKRIAELVDFVETNEPRMIAFHAYLDQDGKSLSIVQVHPDSALMEFHMQVNAKHFATAFDWLDTSIGQQLFGPISEVLAAELAKWDEPSTRAVPRGRVHPHHRPVTGSTTRWLLNGQS
jgi:quinol monooxygenase YgiN